jgi:hypothetical protein
MDPRLYDATAIASGFVPGSGLMDFIGQAPAIGGGMGPSFMQNIRNKQYLDALLQTAGAAGDALMVLPPVGMTVKAATTAGKTARAGSKTADALLKKSDLIQAKRITPPHEVRDNKKLDSLVASMKKNGWQGRPILAFDVGNGLEALTGTHRLAAAKQAGIEDVPVLKISDDIGNYADEYGRSIKDISDEEDVLEYLKNFGDKDAFELMRMEQGQ